MVSSNTVAPGEDHQWIQDRDEVVRRRLENELERIRQAESSAQILDCLEPGEQRKAFLALTKIYHPNRFARRPEVIRQLASEVFLGLKDAYERADSESASEKLSLAKEQATTGRQERQRARTASSKPPSSAARRELRDRRRAQLKSRLGGPVGKQRSAQIRAATAPADNDGVDERAREEARYEEAVARMESGDFSGAASAFKALAVARPSEKRFRMHMHYAQGRVKQASGQAEEALAEYKRALGLDANFVPAHEALSSLASETRKKGSIISKLFGK